jgi:hypothetical protein
MHARTHLLASFLLLPMLAQGQESDPSEWTHYDGFQRSPVTAMRISDLDLRDPHIVGDLAFGCEDFTDDPYPILGFAFNPEIETNLTTDSNQDGFLDLSPMLRFRALRQDGFAARIDFADGQCTAPLAGTSCTVLDAESLSSSYGFTNSGACLAAVPGTLTAAYTPEVPVLAPACFDSAARDAVIDFGGLPMTLRAVRIGAEPDADPATGFTGGIIRGFLRESDADALIVPVLKQPLSRLLPGGANNCALHDDRDTFDGQSGWWMYFEFDAGTVTYTGD